MIMRNRNPHGNGNSKFAIYHKEHREDTESTEVLYLIQD